MSIPPYFLPITEKSLNYMKIGSNSYLDDDKDIIYLFRNGQMTPLGTLNDIRERGRPGTSILYGINGRPIGNVDELELFARNPLVKPTEEQLIRNAKTPPSLKDLAFRQLPTSEIEAALSLNKPYSDPESKTVSSLNNSDSSGGRSRRSRRCRKVRSRKSRKVRKSKRSRK